MKASSRSKDTVWDLFKARIVPQFVEARIYLQVDAQRVFNLNGRSVDFVAEE